MQNLRIFILPQEIKGRNRNPNMKYAWKDGGECVKVESKGKSLESIVGEYLTNENGLPRSNLSLESFSVNSNSTTPSLQEGSGLFPQRENNLGYYDEEQGVVINKRVKLWYTLDHTFYIFGERNDQNEYMKLEAPYIFAFGKMAFTCEREEKDMNGVSRWIPVDIKDEYLLGLYGRIRAAIIRNNGYNLDQVLQIQEACRWGQDGSIK